MGEELTRLSTALVDRYEVREEIGQGGMATVYRAQDRRHDRPVALKVLRPELAAIIGSERFLNEIKVTANLQHPHILPLHDSGDADGFLFYVMPFVEGETLRDKVDREKQLGIDEAIEITRAVASALDYAHRHDVVHRDIKPENILMHDGQPMVADFGIALAVSQAGGSRLTETGLSIGTPNYMSPEQAMGDRELDARSDQYSLAAMLFEMLAGDPPYTGSTAQAIVAKVITEKAPLVSTLRDTVPQGIARAVARALNKLPADRFPTVQGFADALTDTAFVAPTAAASAPLERSAATRAVPTWAFAAGLVATLTFGIVIGRQLRSTPDRPVVRYALPLEFGADDGLDLAPDGSAIAYAKRRPGPDTLFIRRTSSLTSDVLVTALNLDRPFFAPDGLRLAYFGGGGQLLWVGLQGTPPAVLTDSARNVGGSWGDDGFLYFVLAGGRGGATLARIPESGGPIERVYAADSSSSIAWPRVVPGSHAVLFTRGARETANVLAGTQDFAVSVLDLRSGEVHEVTRGLRARATPSGHLLYQTASGVLFAAEFDLDRLKITGAPIPVADSVADFSTSRTGTLVYQTSADQDLAGGAGIALVTREGRRRNLPVPRAFYRNIALSPDARRFALEIQEDPALDGGYLAILDVSDSVLARLTFGGLDTYPAWTPDGARIAFSRLSEDGERDLYWKRVDGRGSADRLVERPGEQFEPLVSRDGRWLVYRDGNADVVGSELGIRMRSLGDSADTVFVDRPEALERSANLSPDGRWLAYISDEVGTNQIFVRPFPHGGPGTQWQVSSEGGTEPVWAHSGRELFYKSGGYMMAAQIQTTPTFAVRARQRLFSAENYFNNSWHPRYVVLPDDSTFAMITLQEGAGVTSTVVVLNWLEGL